MIGRKNSGTGEITLYKDINEIGVSQFENTIEATEDEVNDALLAQAKISKIKELKIIAQQSLVQPVTTTKGLVFKGDQESQTYITRQLQNWDIVVTALGLPIDTKDYKWGSTGDVSKADLQEVYLIIAVRTSKILGRSVPEFEKQIANCKTPSEVENIVISFA